MKSVKKEIFSGKDLFACRVCLATDVRLFSIHIIGIDKWLFQLLGITVSAFDGLPQYVCVYCRSLVTKFSNFHTRSHRAQALLQELKEQNALTTNSIATIDRFSYNFSLPLAPRTHTSLIEYVYEDPVVKYELVEHEEIVIPVDVIKYEENDNNDDDEDCKEEVKKVRAKRKCKEVKKVPGKCKEVKKVPAKRRKRVVREKLPKERKKRKMFEREEDFPAFEAKYNTEIIILTMEQQLENMEARKNSSNYVNSPYKCESCYKGFISETTYKNHNLKCHDPSLGALQCPLCQHRFRIPAFLRTHAEAHRLKFVCKECRFVASNRYHAITHAREHSGFKYVCKYCGASFQKPSTHGTHVRIQHPTENTSCDVCGETFQGQSGLKMHKSRAHKQDPESESASLHCSTCGVQFASAYAMSRHTAQLDACNTKKRACTLCGENLKNEELLQIHTQERHSNPTTKCDECDKEFQTEASLSVHYSRVHLQVKCSRKKATHYTSKQYEAVAAMCELCGKRCKNRTMLMYHQRTHTGEKPHGCPRCPKRFSSPMLLHCHMRSHTGERPYKCSQCPKRFTQKNALTVHQTVHTGEKPYVCSICGKSFTQAASVHTHVKYVHMKLPAPPRRRNLKRE